MEKITNKDIHITFHASDGFTLSYISANGEYIKRRYIFFEIGQAKKHFKNLIQKGKTYEHNKQ